MKLLISVFAALIASASANHHSDAWADQEQLNSILKASEDMDRHPLVPDDVYVLKKNSTFLWEQWKSAKNLFWMNQYQSYSIIEPLWKTDKVNTYMNAELYTEHVVDASGKFVSKKPLFIYFAKHNMQDNAMTASPLNSLARHFDGKIGFRFVDCFNEENLRMTYEVYRHGKAFYIDEEGKAYIYPGVISTNATRDWIETRKYRMSPFQFAAPAIISDNRLKWADIKKEVRWWYGNNLRDHLEPQLKKVGVTYLVDMDPYDWDNVKLNQKTDRQIIIIVSLIIYLLEYVWDLISGALCPPSDAKKAAAKPKSFLKKPAATEEKKPAPKKARGDKIE